MKKNGFLRSDKKEKKLKKFIALILALITLLALVSCTGKKDPNVPEGMTYSENEAVDFCLYYPEDWLLDRNDGMVSVRVSDKDRSNVSVTAFTAPADVKNIEDYIKDEYIGLVEENFLDFDMVSDAEVSTLGGVESRKFVYTASIAGETYKFMQNITYRYGYVYILTYTSTLEGFDSHIDEVNGIVDAFEFKN